MTIAIYLTLAIALLFFPCFLYCDLVVATEDLGAGFAGFFLLLVWLLLSLGLLLVRIRGLIPLWSGIVALPLMPVVYLLLYYSITQMPALSHAHYPFRWLTAVHSLAVLLLFAYMGWASIPHMHRLFSPDRASATVWGAVFALTMLTTVTWPKANDLDKERQTQNLLARRAQFEKIPRDAPVKEWMPYLDYNTPELHSDAAQRIRALKNRQAEMEEILNAGAFRFAFFTHIHELDLSPTPSLCEFIRRWLREQSDALKPTPEKRKYRDVNPGGYTDPTPVGACAPTLRWFAGNKCPMLDELNAFEATMLSYPGGRNNDKPLFDALDEIERMLRQ